jgi:hypothetical protein
MKVPFRYSSKAILNSSWVFMTTGPYQATGSSMGLPANSKRRTGFSAVAIANWSASPYTTRVPEPIRQSLSRSEYTRRRAAVGD